MKIKDESDNANPRILAHNRDEPSVSYFRGKGRYAAKNITDSKIKDVIRSRFKIGMNIRNSTKIRTQQSRTAEEIKITLCIAARRRVYSKYRIGAKRIITDRIVKRGNVTIGNCNSNILARKENDRTAGKYRIDILRRGI